MIKEILTVIGGIVAVPCVVAGVIIFASTVGACVGALSGEILDHVPYLKTAIPVGVGILIKDAELILIGNLDKLGAALGFIGGFFRASATVKKN